VSARGEVPASVLIRGGTVATAADVYPADVLIEDGAIAAIGRLPDAAAAETIDAAGCYVLPGGVDPHVHFQTPTGGTWTCDSFTTGTVAAAHGGVTSAIHFCVQEPGEPLDATVARWRGLLDDSPPVVDVGFHAMVTDLSTPELRAGLRSLPALGVSTFKVFMSGESMLDGGTLLATLQEAARCGAMVMVHAEDGEAIDLLVAEALAAGRVAPRHHATTRPPETEALAVARAIGLARLAGASLYVVHVSSAQALRVVAEARAAGADVTGETCPQYLLLDERCLDGDPDEAAKYLFTPPPRTPADQEALWDGLARGELAVVASDHGGFPLAAKRGHADFTRIPQGLPGVETRLGLLHHHGVRSGRLSLSRLVELLSANPARRFGLYPRKGAIAVGSDADVVVFDPERRTTIAAAALHSATDYSPYDGWEVVGAPRAVLVRGRVVVRDGELEAEPGHGAYLPRAVTGARRAGVAA